MFDKVCWTTAVTNPETITHNLGAIPELIITKDRNSSSTGWFIYSATLGISKYLVLSSNTGSLDFANIWVSTPTSTTFSVNAASLWSAGRTLVAYLFATKAGIQYIGSFVGNGTSQAINCGFTTGARFVCIKATSTTGNWNIGDSTRGIVAGNDPLLYLNSTAAEVTTVDWLDADASGFVVNETASASANTNGVTYLVWAIA